MRWILVVTALIASAGAARATSGGPDLCEVLGWDPVDKKAFAAIHHMNESDLFPTVIYFHMQSLNPHQPNVVGWSQGVGSEDRRATQRLNELKHRLRPMIPRAPQPSIPWWSGVIDTGAVDTCWSVRRRYVVRVSLDGDLSPCRVITFDNPTVRFVAVYPIPGRKEVLAILSFVGIPCEMGYEVQAPVILLPGDQADRDVDWSRYR